jgi:hypothetical protein
MWEYQFSVVSIPNFLHIDRKYKKFCQSEHGSGRTDEAHSKKTGIRTEKNPHRGYQGRRMGKEKKSSPFQVSQ